MIKYHGNKQNGGACSGLVFLGPYSPSWQGWHCNRSVRLASKSGSWLVAFHQHIRSRERRPHCKASQSRTNLPQQGSVSWRLCDLPKQCHQLGHPSSTLVYRERFSFESCLQDLEKYQAVCFSGLCSASVSSLGDNEEVQGQVHVSSRTRKAQLETTDTGTGGAGRPWTLMM